MCIDSVTGGANASPLFSGKAVNIVSTYTFVLGPEYFTIVAF